MTVQRVLTTLAVRIAPNPVSADNLSFYISTLTQPIVNIRVFDVMGQLVLSKNNEILRGAMGTFDVSGLSSGVYFLSVQNGTERVFEKFIKN